MNLLRTKEKWLINSAQAADRGCLSIDVFCFCELKKERLSFANHFKIDVASTAYGYLLQP